MRVSRKVLLCLLSRVSFLSRAFALWVNRPTRSLVHEARERKATKFRLKTDQSPYKLSFVSWLQRVIAVLMLVVWIPAGSYCLLESATLIPESDCCSKLVQPSAADGESDCCFLASGDYKIGVKERPQREAPSGTLPVTLHDTELIQAKVSAAVFQRALSLDFRKRWHFLLRAAPTSRAPDFA